MANILSSMSFEDYLKKGSIRGKRDLMPKGSSNIRVSNLAKLSGGHSNVLYSFSLAFNNSDVEYCYDLVLKGFLKCFNWWHKTEINSGDIENCLKEFLILENLGKIRFPVPTVYCYEIDSSLFGYVSAIMSPWHGRGLTY